MVIADPLWCLPYLWGNEARRWGLPEVVIPFWEGPALPVIASKVRENGLRDCLCRVGAACRELECR